MNCYIHTNRPAVATCAQCGVGLCKDCVDNAGYNKGGRPLCHDCSLKVAHVQVSNISKRKWWALVKFIFATIFLLIGYVIYSDTGDIMNGWIYAGIAGLPAAFQGTKASKRDQLKNDIQDALNDDAMDTASNWLIRGLMRLVVILLLAPIMATISAIKNLYVFIKSIKELKEAENAVVYLERGEDIAPEQAAESSVIETQLPEASPSVAPVVQRPVVTEQPVVPEPTAAPVQPTASVQPAILQPSTSPQQSAQQTAVPAPPKKTPIALIAGLVGVLLLIGAICGYVFWYMPYAKDRDALRTYVVATNIFLRSSQVAGVEYNVLDKLPYGSELITYEVGPEWASVKVKGQKGYVASPYLLEVADFNLLHGVWSDMDARDCIISSKCRLALLDYCKQKRLQTGSAGWQLYLLQKDAKPNNILYPRLENGYDKFTEFAFILKNNATGERVCAIYSFEEESEKPVFLYEESAPEKGLIKGIRYVGNAYQISYTGN